MLLLLLLLFVTVASTLRASLSSPEPPLLDFLAAGFLFAAALPPRMVLDSGSYSSSLATLSSRL